MIGNNSFNFEKETFGGFKPRPRRKSTRRSQWTYVATGSFNDAAAATEAFNNLKDQGVGAIYPYLGGSHEAVVKLSNENDIITMSAGAANAVRAHRHPLRHRGEVRLGPVRLGTILKKIQDRQACSAVRPTRSTSVSTPKSAR